MVIVCNLVIIVKYRGMYCYCLCRCVVNGELNFFSFKSMLIIIIIINLRKGLIY